MFRLMSAVATTDGADWWSRHDTLVVGVVGIIVSGFVGPTVVSWWTSRREHEKDKRAAVARQRDDLRTVVDEAAVVLGKAISKLRPLLRARQEGATDLPTEPGDFLRELGPLGGRLRLRLPEGHAVSDTYEMARSQLKVVATATGSQAEWDAAVTEFEGKRATFLDAARAAVLAPIDRKGGK